MLPINSLSQAGGAHSLPREAGKSTFTSSIRTVRNVSLSRKAEHNKGPAPQPPKGDSLSEMVKQANTPESLNKNRADKVRIIDSLNSLSRKAEHNKGPAPQPPKGGSVANFESLS
jgi:hypothetical protein